MGIEDSLTYQEGVIVVGILAGTLFALVYLLPIIVVMLGLVIVILATGVYVLAFTTVRYGQYFPDWVQQIPIWIMLLVPVGIAALFIQFYNVTFSLANGIIFVSLMILICVYWLIIPTALSQHIKERNRTVTIDEWPVITVLIPAYNEEGYIGPCVDSILTANYPDSKLKIIVIDDGSSDNTFGEAKSRADDRITVLQKPNGGKHSALNYGLRHVDSELIMGIDGDSKIDSDAIKNLIRTYEVRPNACAVAGNIKVRNRGHFITRIQALEYIVSINMFRRALDEVGLVKVVPGCLGLFERKIVEDVGGFSGDTVTEDFDLTMEILKVNGGVHYSSKAVSYTEAPSTWLDLYRQRLRWLRGSVQTVFKHRRIFIDTHYGLLHRILVPYLLLSVAAVPILGFAVLGSIVWVLLFGSVIELLGVFVLFVLLEVLFATLAVMMETEVTKDDLLLIRYAPLTVIGYKQLHDAIMLKSIFDVFLRAEFDWTHVRRTRQQDRDEAD